MQVSRDQRRRQLFDLYAANLALFDSKYPGRFACPICARVIGPEALDPADLGVDLAHVYPESAGGRLETLTCQPCNNRMGWTYDHHLTTEHKVMAAMQSGKPINARVSFDGGSVGVEMSRTPGHVHLKVIKAQTNPAEETAFIRSLEAGAGAKFTAHFNYCDPIRHKIALLHSAYLALFRDFGYEFLCRAPTQWIRDTLTADSPREIPPFLTFNVPVTETQFDEGFLFRSGVGEVRGVRCLAVSFPHADAAHHSTRCVLLPGLGPEGQTAYDRLMEGMDDRMTVKFRFNDFKPYPRLMDPNGRDYLLQLHREDI